MANGYCTKCGEKFAAFDNFCSKCGAKKTVRRLSNASQMRDDLDADMNSGLKYSGIEDLAGKFLAKPKSKSKVHNKKINEKKPISSLEDSDQMRVEQNRHKKVMKIFIAVLATLVLLSLISPQDQGVTNNNNNNKSNNESNDQSKLQYCVTVKEAMGYTTQDAIANCNLFK